MISQQFMLSLLQWLKLLSLIFAFRKVVRGVNLTLIADGDTVLAGCECIKGFAFTNAAAREKSALLPVICTSFGHLRDDCAHFSRVECLLPLNYPA